MKGWTIDFGDVKEIFDPIFKSIDHHPLYELQGLADGDAASVADWIFSRAKSLLPSLYRVDLHETPGNGLFRIRRRWRPRHASIAMSYFIKELFYTLDRGRRGADG